MSAERCQQQVIIPGLSFGHLRRCMNAAGPTGFCHLHSSEGQKRRSEKQDARAKERREHSPAAVILRLHNEMKELRRDAERYRFLRDTPEATDLVRHVKVKVCDWAANLGKPPPTGGKGVWSALTVKGKDMDKEVDAAMRRRGEKK